MIHLIASETRFTRTSGMIIMTIMVCLRKGITYELSLEYYAIATVNHRRVNYMYFYCNKATYDKTRKHVTYIKIECST